MNIICHTCGARLQLNDAKVPQHAFTVRCPKCQKTVNVQPPEHAHPSEPPASALHSEEAATAAAAAPAERTRFTVPVAAPLYRSPKAAEAESAGGETPAASAADLEGLARTLAALLRNVGPAAAPSTLKRGKKVLVCVAGAYQESVAAPLAEHGYEVYTAADAMQAFERMRQDEMDVLVLDPEFDAKGQGYVFVQREIREMRPANRRRLFVVYLSPSVRSGDAHTAFLHSANLVVHPDEAAELAQILETVRRDHDELYRVFREALEGAA